MTSVLCPLPEVSSCSKQSPATNVCDSPELAVTRVQPDKLNARGDHLYLLTIPRARRSVREKTPTRG
jgi:hypothetical protein